MNSIVGFLPEAAWVVAFLCASVHGFFVPFWKRLAHATVWGVITWLGAVVTGQALDLWVVLLPIGLFWNVYVINAWHDQVEDEVNQRGLRMEIAKVRVQYIMIVFGGLVAWAHDVVLVYLALWLITEAYHCPRFGRLKRWGFAQMGCEGLCGALCWSSLGGWSWWTVGAGLVVGCLSVIKDIDDMAGDRIAGNRTLSVWLSERWGEMATRTRIAEGFLGACFGLVATLALVAVREGKSEWLLSLPVVWSGVVFLRWNAEGLVIWANVTAVVVGQLVLEVWQ